MATYKEPDWDLIESDVIKRLRMMKVIWRGMALNEPELLQTLAADIIVPALSHIMEFCECIEIPKEPA